VFALTLGTHRFLLLLSLVFEEVFESINWKPLSVDLTLICEVVLQRPVEGYIL
jgi:hypothetical protein